MLLPGTQNVIPRAPVSEQTILHVHRCLRKALQRAVDQQRLLRNPANGAVVPKPQDTEITVLDFEQSATLLQLFEDAQIYTPVMVLVTTGLRRGEMLALKWKDVDLDRKTLSVTHSLRQTSKGTEYATPKTKKSVRNICLPDIVCEALAKHKATQAAEKLRSDFYQHNGFIFADEVGGFWQPNVSSSQFRRIVSKVRCFKDVSPHRLRHSPATQMLINKTHPKVVSERLGHASISITLDLYSHVIPGLQEDAAETFNQSLTEALSNQ